MLLPASAQAQHHKAVVLVDSLTMTAGQLVLSEHDVRRFGKQHATGAAAVCVALMYCHACLCICRKDEFWIACDVCDLWWCGRCSKVRPAPCGAEHSTHPEGMSAQGSRLQVDCR